MKLMTLLVLSWLICGAAGAWMLEGRSMHFRTVALGPISLLKGFKDTPPSNPH